MSDEDDFEDEEYSDEDGGDEEPSPHEVSFDEETEGVLVAGKRFSASGMTRKQLGEFAKHVEAVAAKSGHAVTIVASGDLTDTGPAPDDTVYTEVHIGLEGGRGGTDGPETISRDVALHVLEKAKAVPDEVWAAIGEKLEGREREAWDEASVSMYFTCVGPLTAATLAFGVLGTEDGEGPGKYMRGVNMEQEAHEEGVWGLKVTYVQYESPESEEVDLGDAAHDERVRELGVEHARYFIIARYD
ncbi:hypothetical protein [Polyangium jinanense]|uniref:Uncharacterized protein n=1 Tax=Polyangium jinanense TaxID=2829994 RepID=A0A9X3XI74_9BACT|nr:hypothetical protein [Polyangium jinanense]MDC3962132.1 hypothetical protein [Polyangium jinanense]MDC3989548.1 hypothetical protein [Polyangium jinanense]